MARDAGGPAGDGGGAFGRQGVGGQHPVAHPLRLLHIMSNVAPKALKNRCKKR